MPEWIGKTIGKVRIEKFLARGGMAEVYLGTHIMLARPVAVKVLHSFIEEEPIPLGRFEREAKVAAAMRHPNIVQIHDFATIDGHPYIVMEYLKGPTLATYLRPLHQHKNRIPHPQVARLLNGLAAALDYAHERGVIHRDVKPDNILLHNKTDEIPLDKTLPEDVEAVLTDFGLVRLVDTGTHTTSGIISGTPAYMSPEQALGDKIDYRTDIYSLGIVLYELLAGHVPFKADNRAVLHMQIHDTPLPIPGIQPSLQKVMDRALAKKPEDRYQTAQALASDYMNAVGMVAEANTSRMLVASSRVMAPTLAQLPQAEASERGDQPLEMPPSPSAGARGSSPTLSRSQPPTSARVRLVALIGIGLLVVGFGAWGISRFSASLRPTAVPTQISQPTDGSAQVHATDQSPTETVAITPVGGLRFQDGTAPADAVTISTDTLPLPAAGSQYEAWLIADDAKRRISIGVISFDAANKAWLTFVDSEGQNLLGKYSAMEITVEPSPDSNPNSSNYIAYAVRLPEDGLIHVRNLLFSSGATPNQIGFIRGLDTDTQLLSELGESLLTAFESGNEPEVSLQAENMLNLIVGSHSKDYKDWNGNGSIDDPGDGYGLLLNGENPGYIQGTFTHADLALTSPNATQNMLTYGDYVKISAINVSDWTVQLRSQLIEIIGNSTNPDREVLIRQAVSIANQIRVGLDEDGNERVEPIPGEGGALTAYEHAYYMADMLIVQVANQTPTP